MPAHLPFIPSEAFYTFSTALDGTQYIFDVRWNARVSSWYYDLKDEDGDIIRAGNRIALGSSAVQRSADVRAPRGLILPFDTSEQFLEATYEDIGVRVQVYYFTEAEMLEITA